MKLKPIKTQSEYISYINWADEQFDKQVQPGTTAGDTLEIVLLLIKQYEDEHYPIAVPDPIEAIKIKMEEKGLKNKDFVGKIGSKGYVSALLNRKKPLTIDLVKFFHKELGIPAEVFLA